MLTILILSGLCISLASCSKDDNESSAASASNPGPLAKQLAGLWVNAYEAKGTACAGSSADDPVSFDYIFVIDAYEFDEKGNGNFYRYFFNENDNLERPGVVWGLLGSGTFTYSSKADGSTDITLANDMKQAFPRQWTGNYVESETDTLIHTKGVNGQHIELERAPEGIEVILSEWNDRNGSPSNKKAITKTIDEDVKDLTYTILKEENLAWVSIFSEVKKALQQNPDATEMLDGLNKKKTRAGTRASRHWEAHTGYYRCFNYTYESIDELGKPVTLSARIMWPKWAIFNVEEEPNNIMLCPHYTICGNNEAPTTSGGIESAVMCGDRILILPDYLGFGVTKDRTQPYLNHGLCAQNCIDAMRAGYKLFRDKAKVTLHKDWKLYVLGLSQGGGNSLATHVLTQKFSKTK